MTEPKPLPRAFSDVFRDDETINVYSYIRFSSKAQSLGFGEVRQLEQINRFFEQYPIARLVERYEDLGVSAFKGKNLKSGQLARFVERIKSKEILPNSLLLVESFDRISRMGGYDALELIISIIQSDCAIYTLFDNRLYSKRKKDSSVDISLIQNILERANDESRAKSERILDAKKRNREKGENGGVITKQCPFWISFVDNKFVLNEHSNAVRRMTELCYEMGFQSIAQQLNRENHPRKYTSSTVSKVLHKHAIYGSFLALKLDENGVRNVFNKEIKNYYPSVISESEFHRISAKLQERLDPKFSGRKAEDFRNIFRGLAFCKCGSTFRFHKQKNHYVDLVCQASTFNNCEYALEKKGVRHRYFLIEDLFMMYHKQIPFETILVKSDDIKMLEKEQQENAGLIIAKEKALANNFSILEKSSENSQKYILSRIDEVSLELDELKKNQYELSLRINNLHITDKTSVHTHDVYKLLLSENGRIKIDNFLHSQKVKLIITPVKKKHFSIDIFHADRLIDTIDVANDEYTARLKSHLE
ncbi:recombinase family protein [Pseudomonas fluorescens]|uniref:recombinase family protein n=1 Tax=Pseudomonas fluorescens TaxID=294 RepID=UPI00177F180B|nr:recombinase family protein [Pseudomonas fluorescens]MBD8239279.1 recombinase family protein [Pseudomonas fluorescens]MDY0897870.1 recombinase family protein [Pseudomonas fluorescens]